MRRRKGHAGCQPLYAPPGGRRRAALGLILAVIAGLSLVGALAGSALLHHHREQARLQHAADTGRYLDLGRRILSLEAIELAGLRGVARTALSDAPPPVTALAPGPVGEDGLPMVPDGSAAPDSDGAGRKLVYCVPPVLATPALDTPLFALLTRDDASLQAGGCDAALAATPRETATRRTVSLAEAIEAVAAWERDLAAPGALIFGEGPQGSGRNVGLGVANPEARLDVNGAARFQGRLTADAARIGQEASLDRLDLAGDLHAERIEGPAARLWSAERARLNAVSLNQQAAPDPEIIPNTIVLRASAGNSGFEFFRDGSWHELVQDPTTPTPFQFADLTDPPFGTACVVSDVVTPQGYREPGSIGLAPGGHASARYRIGTDGAWGAWQANQHVAASYSYREKTPPYIAPGQSVQLCVDTPADFQTERLAGLAIGRYQTFWTVTTGARDDDPVLPPFIDLGTELACVGCPGHIVRGQAYESNAIVASGHNVDLPVSILSGPADARLSVAGGAWSTSGTIRVHPQTRLPLGDTLRLRMAASPDYRETRTVTLQVGAATIDWSITSEPIDLLPDPISLVSYSLVSPNGVSATVGEQNLTNEGHYGRWIQTNPVMPQNFNHTLDLTVSSSRGTAQASVNGGPWLSAATLDPGQSFVVRMQAGQEDGLVETAEITLGDLTAGWSLTTRQDRLPDPYSLTAPVWVEPEARLIYSPVTIGGFDGPLPISASGGFYSLDGGPDQGSGTIMPGQALRPGQITGPQGAVNLTTIQIGSSTTSISTRSWFFGWEAGSWSACSSACAIDGVPGQRTRSVVCRRSDGVAAPDASCSGEKPALQETCNTHQCSYGWASTGWSACSANPVWSGWSGCSTSCGTGTQTRSCSGTSGTQSRSNYCRRADDGATVGAGYCAGQAQPATSTSCSTYCSGASSQSCSATSGCRSCSGYTVATHAWCGGPTDPPETRMCDCSCCGQARTNGSQTYSHNAYGYTLSGGTCTAAGGVVRQLGVLRRCDDGTWR